MGPGYFATLPLALVRVVANRSLPLFVLIFRPSLSTGGTVFPLADTTEEEYQAWNVSTSADKYKQTRTCGPGVVVKPQKGKAVMWYNHHNDRGWLGEQHERSLHGGCNVIKGARIDNGPRSC